MSSTPGRSEWLEEVLAVGTLTFPDTPEEVQADDDFCRSTAALGSCARIVALSAARANGPTPGPERAARYLSRLLTLIVLYDRRLHDRR
jgi:hypothetical protein